VAGLAPQLRVAAAQTRNGGTVSHFVGTTVHGPLRRGRSATATTPTSRLGAMESGLSRRDMLMAELGAVRLTLAAAQTSASPVQLDATSPSGVYNLSALARADGDMDVQEQHRHRLQRARESRKRARRRPDGELSEARRSPLKWLHRPLWVCWHVIMVADRVTDAVCCGMLLRARLPLGGLLLALMLLQHTMMCIALWNHERAEQANAGEVSAGASSRVGPLESESTAAVDIREEIVRTSPRRPSAATSTAIAVASLPLRALALELLLHTLFALRPVTGTGSGSMLRMAETMSCALTLVLGAGIASLVEGGATFAYFKNDQISVAALCVAMAVSLFASVGCALKLGHILEHVSTAWYTFAGDVFAARHRKLGLHVVEAGATELILTSADTVFGNAMASLFLETMLDAGSGCKLSDVTINCGMDDVGARMVVAALMPNTTVSRLFLDGNDIGSEGLACLGRLVEVKTKLTTLCVSHNNVGDEGVREFAHSLRRGQHVDGLQGLQVLDLS
jgi:hypothetical protein